MTPDAPKPHLSARAPLLVGLIALVILVGGFGSWVVLSQIAGAIIAPGQIVVDVNRQVIQHPDGGVVEKIHVDEGDLVQAGAVLISLDPKLLQTELSIVENQLFEVLARQGLFQAEQDGLADITFSSDLVDAAANDPEAADFMQGQESLFVARRDTRLAQIDQLEKRKGQIANQVSGIDAQMTALTEQLRLIEEELVGQQDLLDKGLAQASRVLALRREAAKLGGEVGELVATKAELEGKTTEIDLEILKIDRQTRQEAIGQLRNLRVNEVELRQRRNALVEQLSRLEIRAPVSGIVYDLTIYAERSVIRAAEPLLYLVPQDSPLVISSRVPIIHIDEVHAGQPVTLRFSAFDQRTTPELEGTVLRVSPDAFIDETTGVSYYKAEIAPNPGELDKIDGLDLVPGMPVEAYIRTGDRTPLNYLTKPFTDYFNKAFRET